MNRNTLFLLLALLLIATMPVMAQDPGTPDTVSMVVGVNPDANASQLHLRLDLYVYNDETVIGATAGFVWDNPNLQMDSAVAEPLLDNGFGIGPFFYEDSDLGITNSNHHFLVGGAQLFTPGIPGDPAGRRLWARYYFTLSNWQVTDSIVIDTLTFNAGSAFLFTAEGQISLTPRWAGKLVIKDPNAPQGANMIVSTNALSFVGEEGGPNPPDQTFDISSEGEPLDFMLSNSQPWLSAAPNSGMTDATITVSVNTSGLAQGIYDDTIVINSEGALNAPQMVAVQLEVTSPPNLPPVLVDIGPKETTESVPLHFQVTAVDPDGTTPVLTTSALPGTATFTDNGNGTGDFDWTPGFFDAGVYNVTFYATDELEPGLIDSEQVVITVLDSNRVPTVVFDSGQDLELNEGETGTWIVHAFDEDSTTPFILPIVNGNDTVVTNMVFIDSLNGVGVLTFTPDFTQGDDDPTVYSVVFRAVDETDTALTSETPPNDILVYNVNQVPEIAEINDMTVCVGDTLVTQLSASDADGDPLILWVEPLISNMSFTDAGNGSGNFTFIPDASQLGVYPTTFFASDGTDTVSVQFQVSVIDCGQMDSARTVIVPDFMFYIYQDAIIDILDTIYLGDFIGGHSASDIDPATIKINDSLNPISTTLLESYGDFTGEVLQVISDAGDFVAGYGPMFDTLQTTYTVSGQFVDATDFGAVGDVAIRGHASGDITRDGKINMADLTYLVAMIYMGGEEPPFPEMADMDGSCHIDVADITYFVNFLYAGGPPPANRICGM